jgi:hypothetical protein
MKADRNDPCPCGSGKKYKKCHMAQDEAEHLARLAALKAEQEANAAANAEAEAQQEGETKTEKTATPKLRNTLHGQKGFGGGHANTKGASPFFSQRRPGGNKVG